MELKNQLTGCLPELLSNPVHHHVQGLQVGLLGPLILAVHVLHDHPVSTELCCFSTILTHQDRVAVRAAHLWAQ